MRFDDHRLDVPSRMPITIRAVVEFTATTVRARNDRKFVRISIRTFQILGLKECLRYNACPLDQPTRLNL